MKIQNKHAVRQTGRQTHTQKMFSLVHTHRCTRTHTCVMLLLFPPSLPCSPPPSLLFISLLLDLLLSTSTFLFLLFRHCCSYPFHLTFYLHRIFSLSHTHTLSLSFSLFLNCIHILNLLVLFNRHLTNVYIYVL